MAANCVNRPLLQFWPVVERYDPVKNDTAQDSNDRFLANIQKGGTYSVVPRIPGGEITPEKLIVIGQVAQKYNLYTKITGGQRIDSVRRARKRSACDLGRTDSRRF